MLCFSSPWLRFWCLPIGESQWKTGLWQAFYTGKWWLTGFYGGIFAVLPVFRFHIKAISVALLAIFFPVLGMGYKKCVLLTAHAEAAAKELGIDFEIEKITDVGKITEMGVMTPVLAIDGSVVLSGKTSSHEEIKAILTTLK